MIKLDLELSDPVWRNIPDLEICITKAIEQALLVAEFTAVGTALEVSIQLANNQQVQVLNARWRNKDKPTNILSFPAPADYPSGPGAPRLLGDMILAHGVVAQEAENQNKDITAHLSHLCVHGTLHLLGYNHIEDNEAVVMEKLEVAALVNLGLPDPYNQDFIIDEAD